MTHNKASEREETDEKIRLEIMRERARGEKEVCTAIDQ